MGTFIIFAIVIISVITALAVFNISNISQNAEGIATDSLEDQFIDDLKLVSVENSLVIKGKLLRAEAVINSLTSAVEQLLSPNSTFQNITSYFDYDQTSIPDLTFYSNLKTSVSLSTSSYYFPHSFPNNVSLLTTPAMNDTISRSSHLDPIFRSLYLDNMEFAWLNAAFEEGNVLRQYPGSTINATRTYNHSTTDWYKDVKKLANVSDNRIEYSVPFFDLTTNEWMIKLTKAIFDRNQFTGVISGDLFLESLQIQSETTYKVTNSSYAILMLDDRHLISHPEWNKSNKNLENICDIEKNSDGSCALTELMLAIIVIKENGIVQYNRNDNVYLMAYTSILGKFNLLLVTPQIEAYEFIEDFKRENSNLNLQITIFLLILSFLTLLGFIITGLWLSNRISRPIRKLSNVALQITQNVTENDTLKGINIEDSTDQSDEIGDLTRSFNKMIASLKKNRKN
jgi:HAMP domain-containing protein